MTFGELRETIRRKETPDVRAVTRRRLAFVLACLVTCVVGCGSGSGTALPTAPSRPPSPAPAPPTVTFAPTFTQIVIGETVQSRVSADDPLCIGEPLWPCQYFRVTPPTDGRLDVVMTFTPAYPKGNLDLSFNDTEGGSWWYPISVPVKAGRTYQITIWEYEFPGVEFELRTSLRN